MAGKKNKANATGSSIGRQTIAQPSPQSPASSLSAFFTSFRVQAFILAAIAFIFYYNTFSNEYALDDVMVIQKNDYVHQGFAGIPAILSKDTYDGYYHQMNTANQFSGGRYRPLSVVTFAIEEQLLGKDADENPALGQSVSENASRYMHTRHVVNVLLYVLSVIVFLYVLRTIVFQNDPIIAFIAALLFTIHPIHTEVVANIKSRDEILSFLFICLTLVYAFKPPSARALTTALTCFLLALLSKEYAIVLVVIIPLMCYLFRGATIKGGLKSAIPFAALLAVYLLIRFSIISHKATGADTDLQNNPYLFATAAQRIATKIATLLNYIKLLLLPYPLSADYSYSQVPYTSLSGVKSWASLLVHAGLIGLCIRLALQRHVLSFAIAFYLLFLLLVSNLVFDLGATMGERLIYHSSAGFAIAIAYLLVTGIRKISTANSQVALMGLILLPTTIFGYEVIARNADWKNTNTLFAKDVQTVPNSFLANGIAGVGYCAMSDEPEHKNQRTELVQKGIVYLTKAIAINGKYVNGYYNRALAYNILGAYDKQLADLDSVKKYKPDYPDLLQQYSYLYHDKGMASWRAHQYDEAIATYKEGCRLAPRDTEMWYMLGICYYSIKDYPSAISSWDVTLKLNPNHAAAKTAYGAAQKFIAQSK